MTQPPTAPVPDDTRLLGGWVRHLRRLVPDVPRADLEAAAVGLLGRYGEPHRGYHDARHLGEVLTAVALLAEHADDLPVVVAAAWWHDAVYDPTATAGANERASAELARTTLTGWGAPPERVAAVHDLVLMTADHDPTTADGRVLSDADLAVLAAGPDRYAAYVAGVRTEYAHVSDDAFAAGRAAVLEALLAHDRLYRTDEAHERWEVLARHNVEQELRTLRG
ncbi:HD domain-containing protein [Angustibacter aerolatus]